MDAASTPLWSQVLPYIKLAGVFGLMLLGLRLKRGLALSALAGSFVMALLFGVSPLRWGELAVGVFGDRTILTVWSVVILVLGLSTLMERTGQAERFMAAFAEKITSPIVRLVFFPVLIGLFPMPGGAVFSAPMINAVAEKLALPNLDKCLINYWFRHCAETCWPLFPAMIMAAAFGGMTTPDLVAWAFPLSIFFALAGWVCFIRPLRLPPMPAAAPDTPATRGSWGRIFVLGAPIFVSLAGAVLLEVFYAFVLPWRPLDEGIIIALAIGLTICLVQNGLGPKDLLKTFWHPEVRKMIYIVGALGIFKNVLTGGNVVDALISQNAGTLALWLTATVLPFLIASMTGLLMAMVGSAFPLLVALVQSVEGGQHMAAWLSLGLASGLSGSMCSPLHICFVLSCEYFHVDLMRTWRRVPVPAVIYWCLSLGYVLLLLRF